jgi:phosphoribosylaminoimidazolecarboxamide formyltransferase / IMP cyclohydrolase
LKAARGLPAAASFKHVSPAGAAVYKPLDAAFLASNFLPAGESYSKAAVAYIRARCGDRMCSFGDAAIVSEKVDASLANYLKGEVSDLVIAPDYDPEALEILSTKQKGRYLVMKMDPSYSVGEVLERKDLFGFVIEQDRNSLPITAAILKNIVTGKKALPQEAVQTLLVANIALKYTQSNSVCVAYDGQVIGIGAGQQSRVHCTRLACGKADKWLLQRHPRLAAVEFSGDMKRAEKNNVIDQYLEWDALSEFERKGLSALVRAPLTPFTNKERQEWLSKFNGICLASDAFFPFRDNIDRASRTNVMYVTQAGGSVRDSEVTAAADGYGMVMAHTGIRLFTH